MNSNNSSDCEDEKTYSDLKTVVYDSESSFDEEDYKVYELSDEDEDVGFEDPTIGLNLEQGTSDLLMTSEDKKIIESCQYQPLQKLLYQNRSKNSLLLELFSKVRYSLEECKTKIKNLEQPETDDNIYAENNMTARLAAPYFKTKKQMFSPNPNADVLTKRRNGELSFYHNAMPTKWSKSELNSLKDSVIFNHNINRRKRLNEQLKELHDKLRNDALSSSQAKKITSKINQIEDIINELRDNKEIPRLGCEEFIEWDYISTTFLQNKHNSMECKSLWNLYIHPKIKKSNWTSTENEKLLELVDTYNYQNWERIAAELGDNRTGFSACVHYMNKLHRHFSKERFAKAEDDLLLKLTEKYRIGRYILWAAVEEEFPNRSRKQLVHRYKYFLSCKNDDSYSFTDAEDILLLVLVNRFGRNYSKFAKMLPRHTYMQVKSRYDVHLRALNRGPFTLEDDKLIVKNEEKSYANLSNSLNRSRGQVRQRSLTLKKFFEKNPKASLKDAPRKTTEKDELYKKLKFLNSVADKFKGTEVPSLQDIEEHLGVGDYDELLINFFSNQSQIEERSIETNTSEINDAAKVISELLACWNVTLNIPEDLKESECLNAVDVGILNRLRVEPTPSKSTQILIPPNLNILTALRELLQRNQLYKRTKNRTSMLTLNDNLALIRNSNDECNYNSIHNMLENFDETTRECIENERNKFSEIFNSLFMYSGLLSNESPAPELLKNELNERDTNPVNNKRKRHETKVQKQANKKPRTQSFENATRRKQLCTLEKVQGGDNGHVKTIKPTQSILDVIQTTRKTRTNSDLEDLQKLNEIIKSNIKEYSQKISSKLTRTKQRDGEQGKEVIMKQFDTLKKDVDILDVLLRRETGK